MSRIQGAQLAPLKLADLQEILKQRDEKLAEAQRAQADLLKNGALGNDLEHRQRTS
jgi:cellobiose-specific phosphotransferase system component IIA